MYPYQGALDWNPNRDVCLGDVMLPWTVLCLKMPTLEHDDSHSGDEQ